MRFLLLIILPGFLYATAPPELHVAVERKKTVANQTGGAQARGIDFVEELRLRISVRDASSRSVEMEWYFVARDSRSHELSYYGSGRRTVTISRQSSEVLAESEPLPHYERRVIDERTSRRGREPRGWVVILRDGDRVIATKASLPAMLEWVQKNPPNPKKRT